MCPRWCGRYNPRAHPASFQSPSWLTTPTSMLVRTHPYQPFAPRPVPSRLKGGRDRLQMVIFAVRGFAAFRRREYYDTTYTCPGRYRVLASLRLCGQGLVCQTRQICEMPGCPAHTSRAHLHAPFPVRLSMVVPVPGGAQVVLLFLICHYRRAAGPTSEWTTWLAMT